MSSGETAPNLFAYQDYRAYLRDWFAHGKRTRRAVSYRWFAQRAGFRTSNFVWLVIQGRRNLTEASLGKCAVALGLNRQETEFFRNLVFFTQAATPETKHQYLRRMVQSRKFGELQPIERQHYEYYAAWYHPVVRELATAAGAEGTSAWIAARLRPTVTPAQVERSLQLLLDLGFLRRDAQGRYVQTSRILTTRSGPDDVVLTNFQQQRLALAQQALAHGAVEAQAVSSMTLGISRAQVPVLHERLREFRRSLLELAGETAAPDDVVVLNIQCLPVTHTPVAAAARKGDRYVGDKSNRATGADRHAGRAGERAARGLRHRDDGDVERE